jgi:hypothetical protein
VQRVAAIPCLTLALLGIGCLQAQEIEPHAYAPNPTGVSFLALGFARSDGEVVFDASLPIHDVDAALTGSSVAYGRTFGVWSRSSSVTIAIPYVSGRLTGAVGEDQREIQRAGLGDTRARLGVNLIGAPALSRAEFVRRPPRTALGASLLVIVPTGQYDPQRLINIGSNRWAFKPELGLSIPCGRWQLEVYGGAWLFADNPDFFGGTTRSQRPIASLQAHVSHTFRPRLWIALDVAHYQGGRTQIDGLSKADFQMNTRLGATASFPIGRHQSVRLTWTDGITTRIGGDFRSLSALWQYTWTQ